MDTDNLKGTGEIAEPERQAPPVGRITRCLIKSEAFAASLRSAEMESFQPYCVFQPDGEVAVGTGLASLGGKESFQPHRGRFSPTARSPSGQASFRSAERRISSPIMGGSARR